MSILKAFLPPVAGALRRFCGLPVRSVASLWWVAVGPLIGAPAPAYSPADAWIHPAMAKPPVVLPGVFDQQTVVTLRDGRLMTVLPQGNAIVTSVDEGRTWTPPRPIRTSGEPVLPTRGPLIRTRDGALILIFQRLSGENALWNETKRDWTPEFRSDLWITRSDDEGATWQTPFQPFAGVYGTIVTSIQTRSGQIVVPIQIALKEPGRWGMYTFVSSDEGRTWSRSNLIDVGGNGHHDGAIEATLAELSTGRILMLIRTRFGAFWEAYSDDHGTTWLEFRRSRFDASAAPGYMKRLASGRLVLVWNRLSREGLPPPPVTAPSPAYYLGAQHHRNELAFAHSEDDGVTWSSPVVTARHPKGSLSYPFILEPKAGELWIWSRYGSGSPVYMGLQERELAAGVLDGGPKRPNWAIWTTTDTRHVLRSDQPERFQITRLAAARNETRGFQILLRSDFPLKIVGLEAGDLRTADGAVLPRTQVRLFRQHQLRLEERSYRNDAFKPGWYPDPLIPFEHPVVGQKLEGARIHALPFDLPANETHGFWADLVVPADAKPGVYEGNYRLVTAEGASVSVPVALNVWDFALPRVATLVTEFGSPAELLQAWYRRRVAAGKDTALSDVAAVEQQCAQLLTEHRFNAPPPPQMLKPVRQADGSFVIPAAEVRALREFIDRYQVNALAVPKVSTIIKDPDAERDTLRAWLAAFDQLAHDLERPGIVFFTYLKDEPNSLEDYRFVQKWGRAVREAKSVVKVMVVEQPWTEPGFPGSDSAWGDLFGAVDIWCPLFALHRPERGAERQRLGETLWTYTALSQGKAVPWWHIDAPLLNYRVPGWMAWRDQMKGLLYWGGMSYWQKVDDPWSEAPYFIGKGVPQQGEKGRRFNGEGSLVYPARAVGYEGIAATIRLKALRDAIQDFEYLSILERAGQREPAEKLVRSLTGSWSDWIKDPARYDQARAQLAAAIVALKSDAR